MHFRFGIAQKAIPLLIGLAVVGVSVTIISYVLLPAPKQSMSIEGLDISYDGTEHLSVWTLLQPIHGTQDILVWLFINNWEELRDDCRLIQVSFPALTRDHCYITIRKGFVTLYLPSEEMILQSDEQAKHLFGSGMKLIRVTDPPELRRDVIKIYPKQIEDFDGMIEFLWIGGLKRLSFSEVRLTLPFGTETQLDSEELQLNRVASYEIWLLPPMGYSLVSVIPEPSIFHLFGDRPRYSFNVNIAKTDFVATLENVRLSKIKDYILIISSTLLGIGLALVIQEITRFIRIRTDKKSKAD